MTIVYYSLKIIFPKMSKISNFFFDILKFIKTNIQLLYNSAVFWNIK